MKDSRIISKKRHKGYVGMETIVKTEGYKFRIVKTDVYRVFLHELDKEMTELFQTETYGVKGTCAYTAPKYQSLKAIVEMIDNGVIQ